MYIDPINFKGNLDTGSAILHTVIKGPSFSDTLNLIVVHGGPDWDHSYLQTVLSSMANRVRIICFDLRGCGYSQSFGDSSNYTIDHAARDLQGLLKVLENQLPQRNFLERTWILGFSFGGRVAMRWRTLYQEQKVAGIILASTSAGPVNPEHFDGWREFLERSEQYGGLFHQHILKPASVKPEDTHILALESLPLDVYDLSAIDYIKDIVSGVKFTSEWARSLRDGYLTEGASRNMQEDLRKFYEAESAESAEFAESAGCSEGDGNKELLIIHGCCDMRFPIDSARELSGAIPGSRLIEIPMAGHFVHLEKSDAWCNAISSHIFSV
ncbi:MAG: hypothetical protein CVV64_12480 [Candidatus Wallbacteria bacterium HGW-Wallbacteria-1]|jgi:pimeloyl-ACP methyl ester carboxylesterase|uniref:AB hydrolase-1 domain-containing protein n=1 Tax=Candidatus Wallbacteria bacterium HGW-Wallbacteria-1 TaxID=2013854 RepID=A0A2N1PN98_9BACT|nr:MAG: hypothetical protein CVV64_12480 [Candidatus Wallbacteria bacterium HGW-Wallbacteria-1]